MFSVDTMFGLQNNLQGWRSKKCLHSKRVNSQPIVTTAASEVMLLWMITQNPKDADC